MVPGIRASVTLDDVADPAVARVAIGGYDQTEMELVRGPGGWALAWDLLRQWLEEREFAAWPTALRRAHSVIQARLSTA